MHPLLFLGPAGDLFELADAGPPGPRPGEPVEPTLAVRIVLDHLEDHRGLASLGEFADVRALAAELARGPMSRFVLLEHDRPRAPVEPLFEENITDLSDLAGDEPPPPPSKTFAFELRLVDEMGEPVDGIDFDVAVDGTTQRLTTDGDGRARVSDATLSSATARFTSIAPLRDALRPRWETIRDGDWLDEKLHHSYVDCKEPLPLVSLVSDTLHTVVVQPRVIQARLIGMFFDTSKSFLLPAALANIRSIRSLYDDRDQADVLIVGHTDTAGQPSYNDPLSLERADAVRAYLRDDVDAWLDWYGSNKPFEKRWGSREDNLMLTAVLAQSGEPLTDTPMRHFQATRGLGVDGIAGPQTRRQLIQEYMAFDGTTLPDGVEPVIHGCGENFPFDEEGDPDHAQADGSEEDDDRRVELFFFEGELGVLPPPPGENSGPDSPEYPEWRRRARETRDFKTGTHRQAAVRVCDDEREPIADAPCRFPATGLTAVADGEGFIELDEGIAGEICDIEWTTPGQQGVEPWPFSRRVFVQFPPGEVGDRRKLHNVGYLIADDAKANVLSYEVDFDFEPTGELANISPSLNAWHDGGEQPDPNAPPPPKDDDPTKENKKDDKKATAAPNRTTTKLLVGVTEKGVSKATPMDKNTVSVSVVVAANGKELKHSKVLVDHRGGLIFQYLGVEPGTHDITARRRTPDGDLAAIETKAAVTINTKREHEAVTLSLGAPASFAPVLNHGKKFGFDDFTQNVQPRVTVEKGETDTVEVQISPKGTFAQCTFETDNGNCRVSPKRANKNNTILTIEGVKKGETKVQVMRDGEQLSEFVVKTMVRRTKRVAVRLVHSKTTKSKDIKDKEITDKLNEIYDQAVLSFTVHRLPEMTVDFDTDGDGTMNTQGGFPSGEQKKVISAAKDDSFDFNLFIISNSDDGKTGGHMGFNQRYGFVFSKITSEGGRTAAHELGHGMGLHHVDEIGGKIAGDTDNLMFSTAQKNSPAFLRHFQWNQLE